MATWYVRTTGSDSNAGTTAGSAFLTIGKAMTQASLAAGDTIYVGAGTYRISSAIAPTSMASMTYLIGDTDGSKTGDAGEVVVTTYATNDTTAATNTNVFLFASKNNWTVQRLSIFAGYLSTAVSITGTAANLTFSDCYIVAGLGGISTSSITFGTITALTIERCRFATGTTSIQIECRGSASGSGDIDMGNVVRNCVIFSGDNGVAHIGQGGSTRKAGGTTVSNCVVAAANTGVLTITVTATCSSTYPLRLYNSTVGPMYNNALKGNAIGELVEDYNVIVSSTARTNVTAGTNSKSDFSRSWRYSVGHEGLFGGVVRSFGEYPSGSPLLSWGGTSVPTDDINGITRPASGAGQSTTQQALGPFERSNSATKETTTTRTGGTAIKIAGPGYHDFELAVSPAATNVSVWSYKDANYGTAATAPQLIITNAGEAGFGGTTITSTGGTGAWAAMTATFTPTSAGIVTVRLQSNATVGSAAVYFDDFGVA